MCWKINQPPTDRQPQRWLSDSLTYNYRQVQVARLKQATRRQVRSINNLPEEHWRPRAVTRGLWRVAVLFVCCFYRLMSGGVQHGNTVQPGASTCCFKGMPGSSFQLCKINKAPSGVLKLNFKRTHLNLTGTNVKTHFCVWHRQLLTL